MTRAFKTYHFRCPQIIVTFGTLTTWLKVDQLTFMISTHFSPNSCFKFWKLRPQSIWGNLLCNQSTLTGILTTAKHTVSKLTILTVCEILKDVLPNYKIQEAGSKEDKDEGPKLKKETLKLQKYEQAVLTATKKFLVKLEKIVSTTSDQATVHVKETALR